jgi:hypothetical protein
MKPARVEKILSRLREKLESEKVPDDLTGCLVFNLQTGGLSGKVFVQVDLDGK